MSSKSALKFGEFCPSLFVLEGSGSQVYLSPYRVGTMSREYNIPSDARYPALHLHLLRTTFYFLHHS